jgi:hypothetical protein
MATKKSKKATQLSTASSKSLPKLAVKSTAKKRVPKKPTKRAVAKRRNSKYLKPLAAELQTRTETARTAPQIPAQSVTKPVVPPKQVTADLLPAPTPKPAPVEPARIPRPESPINPEPTLTPSDIAINDEGELAQLEETEAASESATVHTTEAEDASTANEVAPHEPTLIISEAADQEGAPVGTTPIISAPVVARAPSRLRLLLPKLCARALRYPHKKRVLVVLVCLLFGALGTKAWFVYQAHNAPNAVFRDMLTNSYATTSVEQAMTSSKTRSTAIVDLDMHNIKKPVVHVDTQISDVSLLNLVNLSAYSTLQNSYVQFHSLGFGANTAADLSSLQEKWVQTRAKGVSAPGKFLGGFDTLFTPQSLLFGDFLFGNFSDKDRRLLVDFALKNNVYQYDARHVPTQTIDGKKVYVYTLTYNQYRLQQLNQMVAQLVGVSDADMQAVLDHLSQDTGAKVYVSSSTRRIISIAPNTSINNAVTSINYSKYNAVHISAEPKSKLSAAEFDAIFSQAVGASQQ